MLTSFIVGYIATSSATDQHPLELFMQNEGVYESCTDLVQPSIRQKNN